LYCDDEKHGESINENLGDPNRPRFVHAHIGIELGCQQSASSSSSASPSTSGSHPDFAHTGFTNRIQATHPIAHTYGTHSADFANGQPDC
jgi:hypothetical protein